MARPARPRAPLDFVSNGWVSMLIIAAVFAITRVRAIIVSVILRRPAHHLLAIIHKVIVLAFHRSAVCLVCVEFLQALATAAVVLLLVRIVEFHRIAIRRVVLPGKVLVHELALRDRPAVAIGTLYLGHSESSRVVPRCHAAAVVMHTAHVHVRFLRRGVCVLIPEGR